MHLVAANTNPFIHFQATCGLISWWHLSLHGLESKVSGVSSLDRLQHLKKKGEPTVEIATVCCPGM